MIKTHFLETMVKYDLLTHLANDEATTVWNIHLTMPSLTNSVACTVSARVSCNRTVLTGCSQGRISTLIDLNEGFHLLTELFSIAHLRFQGHIWSNRSTLNDS